MHKRNSNSRLTYNSIFFHTTTSNHKSVEHFDKMPLQIERTIYSYITMTTLHGRQKFKPTFYKIRTNFFFTCLYISFHMNLVDTVCVTESTTLLNSRGYDIFKINKRAQYTFQTQYSQFAVTCTASLSLRSTALYSGLPFTDRLLQ